ncbi:MAG TPA: YkvA family protein [Gemmatimonadaceae bacterium]
MSGHAEDPPRPRAPHRANRVAGPARVTRAAHKRTVVGTIRQIPAYLRLLAGLITDGRVSRIDKLLVAGAVAYIVMPLDLVPDFIPFLGQVDDIYLLVLSLQRLISHAGLVVVVDHWAGDVRDLTPGRLRAVLLAASVFLPRGIRRRLRRR